MHGFGLGPAQASDVKHPNNDEDMSLRLDNDSHIETAALFEKNRL